MDYVCLLFLVAAAPPYRSEIISNRTPEAWYSANTNVISDESYSLKPISEIFSAVSTTSSNNPIIFETPAVNSTEISPSPTTLSSTPWMESDQMISTQGTIQIISGPVTSPKMIQETPVDVTLSGPATASQITNEQQIQSQNTPQTPAILPRHSVSLAQASPTHPAVSTTLPNYFLIFQQAPQNIQNYPLPIQRTNALTSSATTTVAPCVNSTKSTTQSPTQIPQTINAIGQKPLGLFPAVRIRMLSPAGSVTNIHINTPTTTTRPTTVRTRRPKRPQKSDYSMCIDHCKGRKEPICSSPVVNGELRGLIDSTRLKGFPSICHMACHNSFRSQAYEKVVDGRCGRLRTRIHAVDSNDKIKKAELNKSQYTIIHSGPQTQTIVEFQATPQDLL